MTLPSLDAVDPEMRRQLGRFHESFGPTGLLAIDDLGDRRAAYETLGQLSSRHAHDQVGVVREDVTATGGTGPAVGVRVYRPEGGDRTGAAPAVLYLHGGGLVMGSVAADDAHAAALAEATGTTTFSVEYRLAPEHPFPSALDDCLQVLRWLVAEVDEVDASRLALFGSSAGGGLAVAVALRVRDEGWPPLRQLVLAAPMLDDRTGTRPNHLPLGLWDQGHNQHAWTCVLGGAAGGDDVPAYAAAARAADLRGLPATHLDVGALDLFLVEDLELGRRLAEHGCPVEVHVYPGAPHGFDLLAPSATSSQLAWASRVRALRRALYAHPGDVAASTSSCSSPVDTTTSRR